MPPPHPNTCGPPSTRRIWKASRKVELQQPLPLEPYATSRVGGALIVVDPASHRTSGALLVRQATPGRPLVPADDGGEAR